MKPGYKQTEVGVIPEEWNPTPLGRIAEIGDGIHTTPIYSANGSYFFINGNNLQNGKVIVTNDTKRVGNIEFKKHGRSLNDRTILMSINGTIGSLAFYNGEPVILGKSAAFLNIGANASRRYAYYTLQLKDGGFRLLAHKF
jgi:type I restriction enzyme S subunit